MSDTSEATSLLARLTAGDQSTFGALFSLYRERLKLMLAHRIDKRLLRRADLSDILQEVYIDSLNRVHHYLKKPEHSFYIWLRQIAMQRLIEVHRQHLLAEKRSLKAEVTLTRGEGNSTASQAWAQHLVASQVSPSQVAMHEEMVQRVKETLDGMDATDREVLALRHFEEMRNSEIAEALGLSEAAASNRYVRALLRLRGALAGELDFYESS